MQRSQSSITIDSFKQKKFWRSLTGSKESSTIQSDSLTTTNSKVGTSTKIATINESRPLRTGSSKKRQSLVIDSSEIRRRSSQSSNFSTIMESSSKNNRKRESSYFQNKIGKQSQSSYNLSSQLQLSEDLNKISDSKELEFYKTLISHTNIFENEEDITEKKSQEEEEENPQPIEESDLSSALADYKLFTEKALDFNYEPTTDSKIQEFHHSIVSSSSTPSFTSSIDTLNSKASIMHTGGAVWVGIESESDDLEIQVVPSTKVTTTTTTTSLNKKIKGSSWCDVNSEEIFSEDLRNDSLGNGLKVGNRTSLLFV